jgi:type IV pilus assembly protein PilC
VPLPKITKTLVEFYEFISSYWIEIVLVIFLVVIFVCFLKKKSLLDGFLLKIPFFGKVIKNLELFKFFLSLEYLISSGYDLLNAIDLSKEVVENRVIQSKIDEILIGLKNGKDFYKLIIAILNDNIISEIIKSGIYSGELDNSFKSAYLLYEKRFNDALEKIVFFIEPFLIFIVALLTLWISLGIFLPLWSVASSINV